MGGNADLGDRSNYKDSQYIPGVTMPNGTNAPDARLLLIGGGASDVQGNTTPRALAAIANFGDGAERDMAGDVVRFSRVSVASATVPPDAVIQTNFINRSDETLRAGDAAFGVADTSAYPVPT
jgi:hypothetical protein